MKIVFPPAYRQKFIGSRPSGQPAEAGTFFPILLLAAFCFLGGCGGDWPYPPGVEERGRLKTDTWETLRRESPWKKPLSEDPIYQRLAVSYQKMEELDQRAQSLGWKSTEEYRIIRFQLDGCYAGARSLVFRLRSSGSEEDPNSQCLIDSRIRRLGYFLEESNEKAARFENLSAGE
ncbi:MAG: hypothetical protein V1789_04315 [PVC group bacterium]